MENTKGYEVLKKEYIDDAPTYSVYKNGKQVSYAAFYDRDSAELIMNDLIFKDDLRSVSMDQLTAIKLVKVTEQSQIHSDEVANDISHDLSIINQILEERKEEVTPAAPVLRKPVRIKNYKTGEIKSYANIKTARKAIDRLDNEYGAYVWREVQEKKEELL